MKTCRHLTSEERAQIDLLHKEGRGVRAIGLRMGRAKSTMSVELRRLGPGVEYEAAAAQAQAAALAGVARRPLKTTGKLRKEIRPQLTTINQSNIKSRSKYPVSAMSPALLYSLNQDEVLNLLAYLMSGGNPKDKAFQK